MSNISLFKGAKNITIRGGTIATTKGVNAEFHDDYESFLNHRSEEWLKKLMPDASEHGAQPAELPSPTLFDGAENVELIDVSLMQVQNKTTFISHSTDLGGSSGAEMKAGTTIDAKKGASPRTEKRVPVAKRPPWR